MQFDPCVFDLKPTCLPLDILTAPYRIAFGHLFEIWEPTNGLCEKITHVFLFVIELIPVANYGICYLDYTWTIESFKEEQDKEEMEIYDDRHRQVKATLNEHGIKIQFVIQSYFDEESDSFSDRTVSFSANRNLENGQWVIAATNVRITREGSLFCRNSMTTSAPAQVKEVNEYLILNNFDIWEDSFRDVLSANEKQALQSLRTNLFSKILSYHESIGSAIESLQLPERLQEINLPGLSDELSNKIGAFSSNLKTAIEELEKDLGQIAQGVQFAIEDVEDEDIDHFPATTGLIDSLTATLDHFLWLKKSEQYADFRTQFHLRMRLFKKDVIEMVTKLTA